MIRIQLVEISPGGWAVRKQVITSGVWEYWAFDAELFVEPTTHDCIVRRWKAKRVYNREVARAKKSLRAEMPITIRVAEQYQGGVVI